MDLIILSVTFSVSIALGLGGTHVILGLIFRILNGSSARKRASAGFVASDVGGIA